MQWKRGGGAEAVAEEVGLGGEDGVGFALEVGEGADEGVDLGDVVRGGFAEDQAGGWGGWHGAILRGRDLGGGDRFRWISHAAYQASASNGIDRVNIQLPGHKRGTGARDEQRHDEGVGMVG